MKSWKNYCKASKRVSRNTNMYALINIKNATNNNKVMQSKLLGKNSKNKTTTTVIKRM